MSVSSILHLLWLTGMILLCSTSLRCTDPEAGLVSDSLLNKNQIITEVRQSLQAFHTADTSRNAEGVLSLLWPDYTMFADGNKMVYNEVAKGSRAFMANLELFHTEWSDVQITALGPDAALTAFQFRDSIITKSGELTQSRGTTSFVWQRRNNEWRVLFADANHYPIAP